MEELEKQIELEKLDEFEKALKEDIKLNKKIYKRYTASDIDNLKRWYMTDFIELYKESLEIPDYLNESMKNVVEDMVWILDIYLN